MKLLELFSGTGSVGKVAKKLHWEVVSLDLNNADINCNILDWDYPQYPSGYFDFVWASPPCIEYSIAKTTGVRKIDEANKIVMKTIETMSILNQRYGLLKTLRQDYLKNKFLWMDCRIKILTTVNMGCHIGR